MVTFGITMVKNEEDIIEATIRHMLTQVDKVYVADNLSTDRTREILESIDNDNLFILNDPDPAYYQSEKMTALAHKARLNGADWIVPFDADEIWYSDFGKVKDILAEVEPNIGVAAVELYNHTPTGADSDDPNPVKRIQWRRAQPGVLPKVACRADERLVIEIGNHGANYGFQVAAQSVSVKIRHFPYRTPEQMVNKSIQGSKALGLTDLPDYTGAHWRDHGKLIENFGPEVLHEVFRDYYWAQNPHADDSLVFDPAPVQGQL